MASQPQSQPAETAEDYNAADRKALTIPVRLPYPQAAKDLFGIDRIAWRALTEAIFPAALSPEGIMLALAYCKARGLDVFKRQCHIVPVWDSKKRAFVETVWPGIAELRTTAARTGVYAGCDEAIYGPTVTTTFKDKVKAGNDGFKSIEATVTYPEWVQFTVYRMVQGQRVPFPGPKVRYVELFAGEKGSNVPNARWKKAPFGQLEKCSEAAALRRAFPEEIGDQGIAEDAHVFMSSGDDVVEGEFRASAAEPKPTRESVKALAEQRSVDTVGEQLSDAERTARAEAAERQFDEAHRNTVGGGERSLFTNAEQDPQPQSSADVDSHRPSETDAAAGDPKAGAGPEAAPTEDEQAEVDREKAAPVRRRIEEAKSIADVDKVMAMHADVLALLHPDARENIQAAAAERIEQLNRKIEENQNG